MKRVTDEDTQKLQEIEELLKFTKERLEGKSPTEQAKQILLLQVGRTFSHTLESHWIEVSDVLMNDFKEAYTKDILNFSIK